MLLTNNLTDFLSQNTSQTIPTMLLISPAGKLLSSSSPLPASKLRTQATLAYSIWTLYLPSVSSITAALSSDQILDSEPISTTAAHKLNTITIQFIHCLMVIRILSCGLLFVAISNTDLGPILSTSRSPAISPPIGSKELFSGNDSTNDAASAPSTKTPVTDIIETKRLAEDVARWLDRQLEGFNLYRGEGRL